MSYKNASEVLPVALLSEVQKYVHGQTLYIPSRTCRSSWGARSGARETYRRRNDEIRALYAASVSVQSLAERFFLSEDSIRKILRNKK